MLNALLVHSNIMMELWNSSSITSPPILTWAHHNVGDVNQLQHITKSMIKVLSKQSPLHHEKVLMARFIYKFDKKFRNDLGYKNFKKVFTAIKKLLNLNILREVEHFRSLLSSTEDDIYLPSKQMLEFLLVKIMTFSKLLLRINVCSKQSAVFYMDRVKRGESHWMSLLPYALLSRVWSISLILLEHTCSWYTNLIQNLHVLKNKSLDFLPSSYKLPQDLNEWLDIKNLDGNGKFYWTSKKSLVLDSRMLEDEEDQLFESILGYVSNINEDDNNLETINKNTNEISAIEMQAPTQFSDDCGEGISRERFSAFFNMPAAEKKNVKPQNKHSHFPVSVNKNTLQHFISEEESLRCNKSDTALTSHLSFMQWQSLKSSLLQLQDSLCSNKTMTKKFQKIWKDKCLDTC